MNGARSIVEFLALSVLGCTSSQAPAPTAGKLEVTIPGTSSDRIKTTLVSEMQKRKFRIANETQFEMSFDNLPAVQSYNHYRRQILAKLR